MAINKTAFSSSGRNVMPLSSTLDVRTRDVDVSGFTYAPIDGQWVEFQGTGLAAGNTNAQPANAAPAKLGLCRMVWSEKGRADLQATGRRRVPVVFQHSLYCELGCYNYDSADLPVAGDVLFLQRAIEDVDGDTGRTRIVAACEGSDLPNEPYWVCGIVVEGPSAAGEAMKVYLYDSPVLTTKGA